MIDSEVLFPTSFEAMTVNSNKLQPPLCGSGYDSKSVVASTATFDVRFMMRNWYVMDTSAGMLGGLSQLRTGGWDGLDEARSARLCGGSGKPAEHNNKSWLPFVENNMCYVSIH